MNMIKIVALAIMLSACSWSTTKEASNIALITSEAIVQYPVVVMRLKEDAGLFDKEEKRLLNGIASRISFLRADMEALYKDKGIAGLYSGGILLAKYQELRLYYTTAIEVIYNKIPYMTPLAAMEVERHIATVRLLDANIQELMAKAEGRKEAISATLSLLSVVTKLAIAAGA